MWVLLMLPRLGEAKHASGHNRRSRHCQVGISGARRRREGNVLIRRQLKRRYVLAFFQKLSPCLVGYRGLCHVASFSAWTAPEPPYFGCLLAWREQAVVDISGEARPSEALISGIKS
jgi:hypothetical protein